MDAKKKCPHVSKYLNRRPHSCYETLTVVRNSGVSKEWQGELTTMYLKEDLGSIHRIELNLR